MADEEQFEILGQGVQVWNRWRKVNSKINIDLSEAYLYKANLNKVNLNKANLNWANLIEANLKRGDLSEAKLRGANLKGADLKEADFRESDLIEANLRGAILIWANLSGAIFKGTDFRGADLKGATLTGADLKEAILSRAIFSKAILSGADLSGADLSGADLSGAILSGAILSGADFSKANLYEALLSKTDLSRTNLSNANLRGADLSKANLGNAILNGANLKEADLSGANLAGAYLEGVDFTERELNGICFQNASLQRACLINANLDGANLTDALLWETQRAGWSIKGVICESVYWDKEAKEKTIYAPGEFERLFADQTKIRLFYKNGITLPEIATLPALIQHLEKSQDCTLRFVSITESAGGAVVELAIEEYEPPHTKQEQKEPQQEQKLLSVVGIELQTQAEEKAFEKLKALQEKLQLEAQQAVDDLRQILKERETYITQLDGQIKGLQWTISEALNNYRGDTYNVNGQVGALGKNANAYHMTFNQIVNNTGESLDLVALASELAQLRMAIKHKQDSSPQADVALGEIAKAEIAAGEKDESGVWQHMKAAGKYALDTANTIGTTLAAEVLKKAMGM